LLLADVELSKRLQETCGKEEVHLLVHKVVMPWVLNESPEPLSQLLLYKFDTLLTLARELSCFD
jgi:hypothetical protein